LWQPTYDRKRLVILLIKEIVAIYIKNNNYKLNRLEGTYFRAKTNYYMELKKNTVKLITNIGIQSY
jgi:hypothetical protein